MSDGWGDALSLTVRTLYLHLELPRWRYSRVDDLTDEQAEAFVEWRKKATYLLGYTRHLDDQLARLLDCAEERLEAVQGDLAAAWACRTCCPESGWQDAPQCARDLYAAVMALGRTAGPEVLLSDRAAVDLIESMTGRRWVFGENRPGITRAKRWLESRGYFTIKTMKGSRTTVYCSVLQGTLPEDHKCLVAVAPDVPDSRPVLGELDVLAFRVSVDWLKAKRDWVPGRAVAEARSELEERQRLAEEREERDTALELLDWLLEPPEPAIRYVRSADSAGARDGGMAAAEPDTGFDELLDPGTRRRDDDEEPRAGHG